MTTTKRKTKGPLSSSRPFLTIVLFLFLGAVSLFGISGIFNTRHSNNNVDSSSNLIVTSQKQLAKKTLRRSKKAKRKIKKILNAGNRDQRTEKTQEKPTAVVTRAKKSIPSEALSKKLKQMELDNVVLSKSIDALTIENGVLRTDLTSKTNSKTTSTASTNTPTTDRPTSKLAFKYFSFLDAKHSTSKHAIDPDSRIQIWNPHDKSYFKELPFRYTRGGWRECRKACDQAEKNSGKVCIAFKFEIGHQTCILIDGTKQYLFDSISSSGSSRSVGSRSSWSVLKPKWNQYSNPYLDDSRTKGRFNYHQHIWGLQMPATLSSEDQIKLKTVCLDLGSATCTTSFINDAGTNDNKLDTIDPTGNLINNVFLTNVFEGEKEISRATRGVHVDWRMCREMCRSMNQNIVCIGYQAQESNCIFYRNIYRFDLKRGPIKALSDKEADLKNTGSNVFGVVRSPRRDDEPTRPYVPHLPASPDTLLILLTMTREKSYNAWGKNHLINSECTCDAKSIGFPDIVDKCAPKSLEQLTRRNFRPGGIGSSDKTTAIQQDQCVYKAVGDLIKKKDKRLMGADSVFYHPKQMKEFLNYQKLRMTKRGGDSAAVWNTYHSYPLGACPVAAPECISFMEIANYVGTGSSVTTYQYRKCCVEHMRLAWITHVVNNGFDVLNVQSAVVFGSLIGPMRAGGLLPVFDTDIDLRTSPYDMVLVGHWLEQILFDHKGDESMLLELGPHVKDVTGGTRESMTHVSFFYGPKSSSIHVDSHVELYAQEEPYILKIYGPIDDVTWPPSRVCMYGRMVSAPRQPCEFLSMVYGGNPCTTGDSDHMKLEINNKLYGAWQPKCFGDTRKFKQMHLYDSGGSSSGGGGGAERNYKCEAGQGAANGNASERQPGSLIKCQRVCDRYDGCILIDYVQGSCRLFTKQGVTRPPGNSKRKVCKAGAIKSNTGSSSVDSSVASSATSATSVTSASASNVHQIVNDTPVRVNGQRKFKCTPNAQGPAHSDMNNVQVKNEKVNTVEGCQQACDYQSGCVAVDYQLSSQHKCRLYAVSEPSRKSTDREFCVAVQILDLN